MGLRQLSLVEMQVKPPELWIRALFLLFLIHVTNARTADLSPILRKALKSGKSPWEGRDTKWTIDLTKWNSLP